MKIVFSTSTFPVSKDDKVPAFVKDQAIELKRKYPETEIIVHAPHNYYSTGVKRNKENEYTEVRFHYFWPFRWELLTGRGIMPALKQNKFLYLQIPFLFIGQFLSLLKIVTKEKPDLIYAHWFTPQAINSALVSKITGIPFVFTTHASDVIVLKKLPFSRHFVRWVCRNASAFTAVSPRTESKLKSFFEPKDWSNNFISKMTIIPMGIYLDIPRLGEAKKNKVMNDFRIPKSKRYLLFLGRIVDIKGIAYLLEAVSLLPDKETDAIHLIIAGDGQDKQKTEKQAKSLGITNVTFTGYVHGDDKNYLFNIADFVCIPSIIDEFGHSEGLPVVLMEGLAHGKVILASNSSGAETIISDGVSGYIFRQKNAKEIKDAIIEVLKNSLSEEKLIRNEATKLARQFDWNTIIDKHYKIFKKVTQK